MKQTELGAGRSQGDINVGKTTETTKLEFKKKKEKKKKGMVAGEGGRKIKRLETAHFHPKRFQV